MHTSYSSRYSALYMFSNTFHSWKESLCERDKVDEDTDLNTLKNFKKTVLQFGFDDHAFVWNINNILLDDSFVHVRAGHSPVRYLSSGTKLWNPSVVQQLLNEGVINNRIVQRYFCAVIPSLEANGILMKDVLLKAEPLKYSFENGKLGNRMPKVAKQNLLKRTESLILPQIILSTSIDKDSLPSGKKVDAQKHEPGNRFDRNSGIHNSVAKMKAMKSKYKPPERNQTFPTCIKNFKVTLPPIVNRNNLSQINEANHSSSYDDNSNVRIAQWFKNRKENSRSHFPSFENKNEALGFATTKFSYRPHKLCCQQEKQGETVSKKIVERDKEISRKRNLSVFGCSLSLSDEGFVSNPEILDLNSWRESSLASEDRFDEQAERERTRIDSGCISFDDQHPSNFEQAQVNDGSRCSQDDYNDTSADQSYGSLSTELLEHGEIYGEHVVHSNTFIGSGELDDLSMEISLQIPEDQRREGGIDGNKELIASDSTADIIICPDDITLEMSTDYHNVRNKNAEIEEKRTSITDLLNSRNNTGDKSVLDNSPDKMSNTAVDITVPDGSGEIKPSAKTNLLHSKKMTTEKENEGTLTNDIDNKHNQSDITTNIKEKPMGNKKLMKKQQKSTKKTKRPKKSSNASKNIKPNASSVQEEQEQDQGITEEKLETVNENVEKVAVYDAEITNPLTPLTVDQEVHEERATVFQHSYDSQPFLQTEVLNSDSVSNKTSLLDKKELRRRKMEEKRQAKATEKRQRMARSQKLRDELEEELRLEEEERKLRLIKEEKDKKSRLLEAKRLAEEEALKKEMLLEKKRREHQKMRMRMSLLIAEGVAEARLKQAKEKLSAEIEAELRRKEAEMLAKMNDEERDNYLHQKEIEEQQRRIEEEKKRKQLQAQKLLEEKERLQKNKELETLRQKLLCRYVDDSYRMGNKLLALAQEISRAFTYSYFQKLPHFVESRRTYSKKQIDKSIDNMKHLPSLAELMEQLNEVE